MAARMDSLRLFILVKLASLAVISIFFLLCPKAVAFGRCGAGLLDARHCIDGHLDLA
jgi:hypothetical protein